MKRALLHRWSPYWPEGRLIRTLPLLAIVALAGGSGCSEDVPAQLESLSISASSAADGSPTWTDVDASGVLAVTGQGRDFQLDVDAGALVIDAHLPGMSNLSTLDGRDVTVAVHRGSWGWGGATISIDDASGPVFIASNMPGASASIGWGEVVAEEELGGEVWAYTTVTVHHDGGEASLLPGEVIAATIDGARWRVVPIAAYRFVEYTSEGEEANCIRSPDALSFEMLRVDAPPSVEPVVRAADLLTGPLSCGG
jgi:hypothetical protein